MQSTYRKTNQILSVCNCVRIIVTVSLAIGGSQKTLIICFSLFLQSFKDRFERHKLKLSYYFKMIFKLKKCDSFSNLLSGFGILHLQRNCHISLSFHTGK